MSLWRFRCFFLFFGGALIGGCAYVALAFVAVADLLCLVLLY